LTSVIIDLDIAKWLLMIPFHNSTRARLTGRFCSRRTVADPKETPFIERRFSLL